jgi:hypothetical protein
MLCLFVPVKGQLYQCKLIELIELFDFVENNALNSFSFFVLCVVYVWCSLSYLYRHLRPELVRKWNVPLNPDAFSISVSKRDNESQSEIRKVHSNKATILWIFLTLIFFLLPQCTEHLKNHVIPEFVQKLCQKYSDDNEAELHYLTPERLILLLHESGINIRYLGLVKKVIQQHLIFHNTIPYHTIVSSSTFLGQSNITHSFCCHSFHLFSCNRSWKRL